MSKKIKVYFDIDGTIAEFDKTASIEKVASPGYFRSVVAMKKVIEMINLLSQRDDVEVYTSSSVFQDDHSIADKTYWLSKWVKDIPPERQIYCPYGSPKSSIIQNKKDSDILIDDFTDNLLEWHGVGVKMYNGINGTKGRWNGFSLHANMSPALMLAQLNGIISYAKDIAE